MISHLGPQMGVADGIALANKLKKNGKITAVFTGEGATSEGDFHEALNIASVWDLPVMFVIETEQEKEAVRALYDAFFRSNN